MAKGTGPFKVILGDGGVFDVPSTEDTFEINGAILTVLVHGRGKAEDQTYFIRGWQQLAVDADNVD